MILSYAKARSVLAVALSSAALLCVEAGMCGTGEAEAGASPAQKCEAGKNQSAGRFTACLHKAKAKLLLGGEIDLVGYDASVLKCEAAFNGKWQALEDRAAGACPIDGDAPAMFAFLDENAARIIGGLDTGDFLAGCRGGMLATNQSGCYTVDGQSLVCETANLVQLPGQDGEYQYGAPHQFQDNGDGTITDRFTNLTWEKQTDDGSIHDKDNYYTWEEAFSVKVAGLNAANFAGSSDWRVPNINEVDSLSNFQQAHPALPPTFQPFYVPCDPGCSGVACSCTNVAYGWWSSTTSPVDPLQAFNVGYPGLTWAGSYKTSGLQVRAVRGGY